MNLRFCETYRHRFPHGIWMQFRDSQQSLRRAAGFASAAFPFADGGEGDAEHGGEVLLGEIELIADLIGTVEGGPADMSVRKKDYLKSKCYDKPHHR